MFRKPTYEAVRAFQSSHGLPVDGTIGAATWKALLTFEAASPRWSGRQARRRRGATASRAMPPHRPLSASLPAKAYEIDPGPAP
jgi:peptidoglycan hydrolase-like protein with peptidoglycan-binding domain